MADEKDFRSRFRGPSEGPQLVPREKPEAVKPDEEQNVPQDSGTLSGKASGDINQHAPTGPIVGEVFKSRSDLQPRDQLHHQRGTRQHHTLNPKG